MATRYKPGIVLAAGSLAFTITSAIIVTLGHFLVAFVPVTWITLAGGAIMIGYGIWSFLKTNQEKDEITAAQRKLSAKGSTGLTSMFLSIVAMLVLLDLAGDATELLTILFVARFQDPLMVFTAAVAALIAATAVETTIGSTMSKILSTHRIRIFSLAVFLIIGTSAILSVVFHV